MMTAEEARRVIQSPKEIDFVYGAALRQANKAMNEVDKNIQNHTFVNSYIEKKWGNNSGNNNNSAQNNNSSNATGGAGAYTGMSSAFRTSSTSGSSAGVGGPSYNSQYNNSSSSSTYSYQYNIGQPSYSTNGGQNDRKYGTANNQLSYFQHQWTQKR